MKTVFKKRKITSSSGSHDVESDRIDKFHQVDRISDLPDCVTSHILSRLPTKDAVRSCVLSKDWKYKWTSIYNIDIDDEYPLETKDRVASFRCFVDKVVDSNPGLRIRKFRLALGDASHNFRHLKELIRKILTRGVKNISIVAPRIEGSVFTQGNVVLPKCILRRTSLTRLNLSLNCSIEFRTVSCFPKLKRLHLSGGTKQLEIMNKQSSVTGHLSLTFPALQILKLASLTFSDAKSVVIDAPVLTKYKHYCCGSVCEIKIVAPKLVKFEVLDGYFQNYELFAPALRSATLVSGWLSKTLASQDTASLNSYPNLNYLRTSGGSIEEIFNWKRLDILPSLNQLQQLHLHNATTTQLLKLLHATPGLQSLTLHSFTGYWTSHEQETVPPCIVSQLKKLKIIFRGGHYVTGLVNFFLDKANKLKRVSVYLVGDKIPGPRTDRWLATLGPDSSSRIRIIKKPKCWMNKWSRVVGPISSNYYN